MTGRPLRICHVTAHLPPDQAANALLPLHLGRWAREGGHQPSYVAYPPRAIGEPSDETLARAAAGLPGPVTWLAPRGPSSALARTMRLSSLAHAAAIRRVGAVAFANADIVHVHSNGLLPEVAALQAASRGKPVVLTLYGTEVWHYRARRFPPQLFTTMYRRARHVTFYSQGLLDRARELGLNRSSVSVVYPPVAPHFGRSDAAAQAEARARLGLSARHVLLNVKRLHPLAGQHVLIDAMPAVLQHRPDTQLVFCGTGPLAEDLRAQASRLGIGDRVVFAGLVDNERVARFYAAADLFVLPSELEACPTVAVEALASGTPVVSTDNPGGVELGRLFGEDVRVVPRGDAAGLAAAISGFLAAPRRTMAETDRVLAREFAPEVSVGRFMEIYRHVVASD